MASVGAHLHQHIVVRTYRGSEGLYDPLKLTKSFYSETTFLTK